MPRAFQKQVENETPSHKTIDFSKSRMGFLTEKQFRVLSLRSRGYTQRETSIELQLSRSSVSMLEARALKQVERARHTLKLFELTQTQHVVRIQIGTRLQQIPLMVLQEADKYNIHLRKNMVEILRMVKKENPDALSEEGRTLRKLRFTFNERGRVSMR
jgi:Tfx family DNA-binding protein